MSLSLERMRYLVRKGLGGLSDSELTDVDCDELLNLALWNLSANYPFEAEESQFSTPLVEDQFEYSVSDADLGVTLDYVKRLDRDWETKG